MINSDLGAKSVDELIAVSKQKPGTLSYLTASIPCVVYMDNLRQEKGGDWVRVPFKGGGEATNAILGGSNSHWSDRPWQRDLADQRRQDDGAGVGQQYPHATVAECAHAGRSRLQRRAVADVVRTVCSPGTPKAAVDKIAAEVTRVMSDPGFRDKYIISRGQVPAINTPEQFAAEIKADRAAAKDVVKASGLEPQ